LLLGFIKKRPIHVVIAYDAIEKIYNGLEKLDR